MRLPFTTAVIAIVLSIFGCKGRTPAKPNPLAKYSSATILPGVGMDDLKLGKTTLGWFIENIGSGTVSTLTVDVAAIQLEFENGEASFLFVVRGKCQNETDAPRRRLDVGQDISAFIRRFPACADLTLSSISVSAPRDAKREGFYKGSTDRGVRLVSPASEIRKQGSELSRPGQLVAGETDDNLTRLEFPGGIYIYHTAGTGPTAEEIASGKSSSPERLAEIKKSSEEAAETAMVKKITVFVPDS